MSIDKHGHSEEVLAFGILLTLSFVLLSLGVSVWSLYTSLQETWIAIIAVILFVGSGLFATPVVLLTVLWLIVKMLELYDWMVRKLKGEH